MSFYERAKDFPTVTVEVEVEKPPSQRAWARQAKRDQRRANRKRIKAAVRERRAIVRNVPRLSERQRRLVARAKEQS